MCGWSVCVVDNHHTTNCFFSSFFFFCPIRDILLVGVVDVGIFDVHHRCFSLKTALFFSLQPTYVSPWLRDLRQCWGFYLQTLPSDFDSTAEYCRIAWVAVPVFAGERSPLPHRPLTAAVAAPKLQKNGVVLVLPSSFSFFIFFFLPDYLLRHKDRM